MSETLTRDNLLLGGEYKTTHNTVISIPSTALVRGTVLGMITATSKLVIVNSANTDGSQNPYGVLAEDVAISTADVSGASVYVFGEFNEDLLVFGGTDTKATHRAALRDAGIYLNTIQA